MLGINPTMISIFPQEGGKLCSGDDSLECCRTLSDTMNVLT